MNTVSISLFGPPSILVEHQPFDTDRRKAIALLAYLIETGKPQNRQQLAALLWPDYSRESAFAYLRRTLYELNKGLGTGWLVTDRDAAAFNLSGDAQVDTVIFTRELAAARSSKDPLQHLEKAAGQYKGEFMAGFFLQDAGPFENWLRLQQESYQREYGTTLEQLASIYAGQAAWEPALKHALAWILLDNLNEAAYRLTMRIYAGMGDRSSALRQYEACALKLKEALRVKPQSETTELYERIRTGSFEFPQQPAESQVTETKAVSNVHLPVLTTPFIGRRSEVEQVIDLILNPGNRLVTLFGPGGAGKTRLSIQIALEICDQFKDGVWFVSLVTVQAPGGILPALAKSFNLAFHREKETQRQQLLEFLRKKRLLLVLDNLDQLVSPETADLLVEILTISEELKLLVTSRERLNIQAEQVFPVPGMRTPTPNEAEAWTDPEKQAALYSAVQLFLSKARRIKPDFTINRSNAAAIAEICQMVSGMPLGVELAASWLELLRPEEIKEEIRRSLDFLETDQPDVPNRQRSIRAVFDHSWTLLDESERETIQNLSVFNGSFPRDAAQQVTGASLRKLLSLANKSWLQQVEEGRFQLHPLLQHYGFEQLRQQEHEWRNARDRHAAYYARFMADQTQRLHGPEQLEALDEISREFDTNVKAAWEWLAACGQWAEIREKMALGFLLFGNIRWRGADIIETMRNSRLMLEHSPGTEERLTRAILGTIEINFEEMWAFDENQPGDRLVALWNMVEEHHLAEAMGVYFILLGKIYTMHHPSLVAEERVETAIEAIRKQNDPWSLGMALLLQSFLWGQFPKGESLDRISRYMHEALEIFKRLGTIYEQGEIFRCMAEIASARRHPLEEIVELYRQAKEFSRRLNDLVGIGMIDWDMGNLYFQRGHPEEGFATYHDVREVFLQLGNKRMTALCFSWESIYASRYSTFEHALEMRQQSMELSQKYWSQAVNNWDLLEMGEVYRIFGNQKKALEYFEDAQLNFKRINMALGTGYCQRGLGDIAIQEGRYEDALQHYLNYQTLARQDNHEWSISQASVKLSWIYALMGEVEQSRRYTYDCLKRLQNADEIALELMALLCEARCLAEEGKTEPAIALAAFVTGHPITWNETRALAKTLSANLIQYVDKTTLREVERRFHDWDVREMTGVWLENYESAGNMFIYTQT